MSDTPLPKPSQPQVGTPQPLQPDTAVSVGASSVPVPAMSAPTPPPAPPKPVAPPAPVQAPAKPQMPPTTLTALSSMSSTNVPPASQQPVPPPQQFESGAGTKATVPTAPTPQKKPSLPGRPISAVPQPPAGSSPQPRAGAPAAPVAALGSAPVAPTVAVAQPRKSVLKFLPIILGGLMLLGVIAFAASKLLGGSTRSPADTSDGGSGGQPQRTTVPATQATIEYWGLWEPSEVLSSVIAEYEEAHPGVKINYTKQAHQNYRERLETAISSGTGPDLFRFHASWTPMLAAELAPVPGTVISASEFKSTYYPAASTQLQHNGQYVGIPLMYDGLALLYNKDILDTAGAQPPTTWAELGALATRLTVRSGETVQRSGIALGNATNVEHFSDILALLMLQNGADFTKPNTPEVRDALLFYTKFVRTDRVWNDTLPASTVAFARGDAAMVFAPSWRIHEIQARNPNLKIGVAPVPKLSDDRVAWATFWAEGVNAKSKNSAAAFEFLKYLSSKEVLEKMYSDASKVRAFGELYPRVDMADSIADNPLVAPYLQDAPHAKGWHMSSFTLDNGINDQLIKYYEDAVTAIATGKSADDVLSTVEQGSKQVLRQYGVTTNTTQ